MHQADLFLVFTQLLESSEIRYMVSGSVASMIYGEPRLTNDIDVIVYLDAPAVRKLAKAFPLDTFYCPPEEVIMVEARRRRRGHFNLIHHETGHKADIYVCGDDPLHAWGFANRRQLDVGEGRSLWVAPPEYVILRKLEYFREGGSEKHKSDIRGMLDVLGEDLDRTFLDEWTARLGVADEWNALVSL